MILANEEQEDLDPMQMQLPNDDSYFMLITGFMSQTGIFHRHCLMESLKSPFVNQNPIWFIAIS